MLADQAHQRDQAHLGVDVEAGEQVDEDQRAEQRQRHRHQDHHRIAQAVELRRQRQEHDDDGEQQGAAEAARFLHELARLAGVVHGVAAGRHLVHQVAQVGQRVALRHARDARDGGRVQLLEAVQRLRHHLVGDLGHGAGLDHRAVWHAQVVVQHLLRIEAVGLQYLRDHPVRAPGDREVVDVAAAQRRTQRGADVGLGQAQRGDHVAVEVHRGLRLVHLQVGVDEVELAAGLGLGQHRAGDLVEVGERFGGGDHHLDRQALRARQRRELERGHVAAGDAAPLVLQYLLQFVRAAIALVPRLEQHAADALVHRRHAGQLEHLLVLG